MLAAIICREYGWTYQEYMDEPASFLLIIRSMLEEEALAAKEKHERK